MSFRTLLPVRFADVDRAGIVYYPRILHYCHVAFEEFWKHGIGFPYSRLVDERKLGFPTVKLETEFERPFRYGMEFVADVAITKLGNTSVGFRFSFFESEGGPRLAIARNVTVCVNMDSLKPEPLPDDLRATLSRFLSGDSIDEPRAGGSGDPSSRR